MKYLYWILRVEVIIVTLYIGDVRKRNIFIIIMIKESP